MSRENKQTGAGDPRGIVIDVRYVELGGNWEIDPEGLLAVDEEIRASKLGDPEVQLHYRRCRSFVRTALGHQLGMDPKELSFTYGEFGKPALELGDEKSLSVSWTQSEGWAAIATAPYGEIGVDLEIERKLDDPDVLAQYAFSENNLEAWRRSSSNEQSTRVLRAWVRKEAIGKADGRGFQLDMRTVQVRTTALPHSGVVAFAGKRGYHWSDWGAPGGLMGAVAANVPIRRVDVRPWRLTEPEMPLST